MVDERKAVVTLSDALLMAKAARRKSPTYHTAALIQASRRRLNEKAARVRGLFAVHTNTARKAA